MKVERIPARTKACDEANMACDEDGALRVVSATRLIPVTQPVD